VATLKNYPHTIQLGDVTKIDWNAFLKEPWQSMFKENDWQEKHFRKLLKQTEGDGNVA